MELWNAAKTARFLGITYTHLWRLISEGKAHPPFVVVGERKRFIREEVERWVRDQRPNISISATDGRHDQ